MSTREDYNRAFAALANPTRRDIIARTSKKLLSVGTIANEYPISQPAVSKHLHALSRANLVTMSKNNKHVYVAANRKLLKELAAHLNLLAKQ